MAASRTAPKGILKKTVSHDDDDLLEIVRPRKKVDPRELAIQHAQILQHRKDLERQILDSIITLSEYPLVRADTYSASAPAPSDAADFKKHVRLFQPSDYDALVEERNVNGLCGYTLCSRPRSKQGRGGQWKLASTGIVQRKELEKWCSKACAKRALYVKVQLNETAAWERAGIPDIHIDLLDEMTQQAEDPASQVANELDRLRVEDEKRVAEDSAALALERGTTITGRLMQVTIREKEVKPPSPILSDADDSQPDKLQKAPSQGS